MNVSNKAVIITGGARGIGYASVTAFARRGAKVVIADYDQSAGEEAVARLKAQNLDAVFTAVDVTDRASVMAMVEKALAHYQRIDVLINNAGITADSLLVKMTEEQFDKVIAVNLKGTFNCTQAVVPMMISQGKGTIINTSSVIGLYGNIGQTNYAATKAGVIGMTKSWAKELGRKGINVNAVAPGFIITEMSAKVPEKILKSMEEKTPLGRLGSVEDVANAYLFLASEEAAYINGTVLSVDGGLVL
ncbi:MAG: 3-oxoacyl-[acyl-carrier-protein] reductase [Clostridia bacterium]|nr:3-oxoacyl-[acyl-carrier-protein] reductase [Clostridia bacterium]